MEDNKALQKSVKTLLRREMLPACLGHADVP